MLSSRESRPGEMVQCNMCPARMQKNGLAVHQAKHNRSDLRYTCRHCDYASNNKKRIKTHEKLHLVTVRLSLQSRTSFNINQSQMADDYQVQSNGHGELVKKPLPKLYVMASEIDSRRIGAGLICQQFWMELYALYEIGVARVEVETVNVNSEAFKKNFLGAQPPIMVEEEKQTQYTDNREIEGRIFHLAKEFRVPLFEKDAVAETTYWRPKTHTNENFKLFLCAKEEFDNEKRERVPVELMPSQIRTHYNRVVEQLGGIDELLQQRGSRYLLGNKITKYDCILMPQLHHMQIVGKRILGFDIPHNLTHLWNYVFTAYRTAAFIESCPADQDILHHYKKEWILFTIDLETLQAPTKTHTLPEEVLNTIKRLGLDQK